MPSPNGGRKQSVLEMTVSTTQPQRDQPMIDPTADKRKWTLFRSVKVTLLLLVTVWSVIMYLTNDEQRSIWTPMNVTYGETEYLNLTNKLDRLNPVFKLKAKSHFIPLNYENLTTKYVEVNIIQMKGSFEINTIKAPWKIAIADDNQHVPVTESNRTFVLSTAMFKRSDVSEEFEDRMFEDDVWYRASIRTNDDNLYISFTFTTHSDFSMYGIVLAGIVLLILYGLIIFDIVDRTLAAIIGGLAGIGALSMVNNAPPLIQVINWLDFETLALLFGMMLMVAILSETGFFDYVAILAFKLAKGKIQNLLLILCVFTGVLSAFLDNATTVLLMTPVTIKLCEIKNMDPRKVLIAQVLFSNIGGAATPVGDPPNVIIINSIAAKNANIDFITFTYHVGPGVIVIFVASLCFVLWIYRDPTKFQFNVDEVFIRKEMVMTYLRDTVDEINRSLNSTELHPPQELGEESTDVEPENDDWRTARSVDHVKEAKTVRKLLRTKLYKVENVLRKKLKEERSEDESELFSENLTELEKKYCIKNKPLLIKCTCVMIVVTIMFFMQGSPQVDISLGYIAIYGAMALLILTDPEDLDSILHRIEWSTLIFFAALFVVMESLAELKLLWYIGQCVEKVIVSVDPTYRLFVAINIILWTSALASSFIDNIPFATVMIKIIKDLSVSDEVELPIAPLIYALAFGACLGGNGTLIGASANVVCAGIAEKHGYKFSFMDFFKIGFPVMLLTVTLSNIYLVVLHVLCGVV